MRVPTPQECGLPEKFDHWRPTQEQALYQALHCTTRVDAPCLPTGSGKTAVAIAKALVSKKPTCLVTDNRGLQDQAMEDFAGIGLVDLRGRNNYPCGLRDGMTCEDGYASRCLYMGTPHCAASRAEMRAASSYLVTTNYAKWTRARKFGQGLAHIQQVIFDEGHKAPQALADAMQVTLHPHEINEVLGMNFPPMSTAGEMDTWKPWAAEARAEAEEMMIAARLRVLGTSAPKPAWIRHFVHLRNLCRKLAILSTARAKDWVVGEAKDGYQFDPIRPGRYAESALFLKVPSIMIMSATIRPKTLWMLGLAKETYTFREYPSDFDPKRCPIYWVPTMRVDSRAKDLSMLWMRLDQIAAKRRDRKGIVHTVSYARRDEILAASRFAGSMLINPQGEAAGDIIEMYREGGPGTILVSPSVGAGYDFPGDACEWQFVCKIPFPDGRSKIVKARQEDDKEYGPYQAMQTLVQTFGRGMRSREDQCENFICDDHIEWFLPRYGHLAPSAFHAFFQRASVLPQPPPRIGG